MGVLREGSPVVVDNSVYGRVSGFPKESYVQVVSPNGIEMIVSVDNVRILSGEDEKNLIELEIKINR